MVWTGFILGLLAAIVQSVAYIFSRRFIIAHPGGPVRLLLLSHVLLGVMSIPVLVGLWDPRIAEPQRYIVDLLGAAGFYFTGQGVLFLALRQSDASRVSPLLGLKVMLVALLFVTLMDASVSPLQWVAVGLSVVAAFVLNYTGGSLPPLVIGATFLTCLGYALSDLHIIQLVPKLGDPGTLTAAARTTALTYMLCGLFCLPFLSRYGSRRPRDWGSAMPYAAAWFGSMYALFASLAMAGPVLANIVLSTRGLWSIALGAVLASMGLVHLEQRVEGHIVLRRAGAAVLMMIAIGLYWAG